jgi:hypothetical protein
MALVRCPACGRVASGSMCFACGQSLDDTGGREAPHATPAVAPSPSAPHVEDIYSADELGVVTEPPRQPPPIETWAVRAPGQSLDVLSAPQRPRVPEFSPSTTGPVVEGIAFDDGTDGGLAVVTGAPLHSLESAHAMVGPPSTTGYAASPDLRSNLDPFAPFTRSRTPAAPPAIPPLPDDDLSMMAGLASESGAGLVDFASDGPSSGIDALGASSSGFDIDADLDIDVGPPQHAGASPVRFEADASPPIATRDASFAIEMTDSVDVGGGYGETGSIEMTDAAASADLEIPDIEMPNIEMTDGFDLSVGIDNEDGTRPQPADAGADLGLDLSFDTVMSGFDAENEVARPVSASPDPSLDFDFDVAADEPPPAASDAALAASFFNNDDLDLPVDDARRHAETVSALSDATALIARPFTTVDDDKDPTALIRSPLLHLSPPIVDDLADSLEPEQASSPASPDSALDEDPFGLMSGVSFPHEGELSAESHSGLTPSHPEVHAAPDPGSAVPFDDVPEPPSLDDFDVPHVENDESTLPLIARPTLPPSSAGFDFSDAADPANVHPEDGLDDLAVEVAPLSNEAPGTTRALLDDEGKLVPHSAHASATQFQATPLIDEAPVSIERAYARDMSARVVALAEEMEGSGRFEAAALLYEVQAALDGT